VVGNGGIKLHKIEHYQKIFTTEDGVDIFEGDNYYSVFKADLLYNGMFKAEPTVGGRFSNPDTCKVFSTKQAAEEYILMNKPCLSIEDIKSVSAITDNPFKLMGVLEDKLKSLVKSKL
jgi:hypothetical protein